jgi:hypothetical protein
VRLLRKNEFNIAAKKFDIMKALDWAASNRHEAAVQLLVEMWADVTAMECRRCTLLHRAASNGREPVVRLLV